MKFPFHPWRRLLLCALPFAALLTACDDGKKEPPPKPAEVTTYNSVPWAATGRTTALPSSGRVVDSHIRLPSGITLRSMATL